MLDPVLLELPAQVETERLLLRPPAPGDGALLYAGVQESLADLRRFLAAVPWVGGEQSVENSEIYCRNSHANFLSRKDLPFLALDKATGELIGATGLHRMVWNVPKAEIGCASKW